MTASAVRLVCVEPGATIRLETRPAPIPEPGRGEVRLRVEASSVNPIDVRRAHGYGRRLLALKGAGRFPLVLGNDVAGVIEAVGPDVDRGWIGERVFGLVPVGPSGAHATHLAAAAKWLRPAAPGRTSVELAAFPYTFTTARLALAAAGLGDAEARGAEVLVHGAGGGLGRLAVQLLVRRGARVTAICSGRDVEACRDLGAATVVDRGEVALGDLPGRYDATLNFGNWADEAALIDRSKTGARAHVTAVHPLLDAFDRHGFLCGAWHSWRAFDDMRSRAKRFGARHRWITFAPSEAALDELADLVATDALRLPVGIVRPPARALEAFEHVERRLGGRAILDFSAERPT